jgi:hypothetical protein
MAVKAVVPRHVGERHMTPSRDDPSLSELLGDPMTQAIMDADGVDARKLAAMLRSMARQISRRSLGTATIAAEGARPDRNAVGPRSQPVGVFRNAARCGASASRMRSRQSRAR